MEQLVEIHGRPAAIRCDNGAELTSYAFTEWCRDQGIEIRFIQAGKPDQNAFIERFNRTYREEVLSPYLFDSIEDVRLITDEWLERYNQIRPHDALGSLPPERTASSGWPIGFHLSTIYGARKYMDAPGLPSFQFMMTRR